MERVLSENIFEFHNQLYRQEIGAAMGSRPIPSYANIFMAEIDEQIRNLANKYNFNETEALRLLKRFLDDYFILFVGSTKELHQLIDKANKIQIYINYITCGYIHRFFK